MPRPCTRTGRLITAGLMALAALAAGLSATGAQDAPPQGQAAAGKIDFDRQIRPILVDRCVTCHGPEKQKHGLRLDLKTPALRGGDSGKVIIPGKPHESLLIKLITGGEEGKVMPAKGERLTAAQIENFRNWIAQGAAWPDDAPDAKPTLKSNLWSLQPISRPPLPTVKRANWPRNPIDHFILARLEKEGLAPAPEADRATLIRRITFDLTGLPPTPERIKRFIEDSDPRAYEKLVDELLASEQYGQRWARHWLDIARYTESQGFEYDRLRPNAWHYRDYVIESLNADKPYDRFMMEQVAGDVMTPVRREGMIATSFLVCGPWDQAGNGQANATQRAITREEEMEDLVSVVSQSFLGLTINCARCHAHKFDPIPHEDYFRLRAIFDGVKHGERPIDGAADLAERKLKTDELNRRITELSAKITEVEKEAWAAAKLKAGKSGPVPPASLPTPAALWTFETDAKDSIGGLHGELIGGARIERGRLIIQPDPAGKPVFLKSAPLIKDLAAKTLEAWVYLPTLEQGGGGVIGVEAAGGSIFDAIVYAERQARKWVCGSESFTRTKDLKAETETAGPGQLIHVAAVYRPDHSITLYRNGKPYAETYTPRGQELRTYKAGQSHIIMGIRHTGGGRSQLAGEIERAAIYDRALSDQEIAASAAAGGILDAAITPQMVEAQIPGGRRAEREGWKKEVELHRAALRAIPGPAVSYVGLRMQPPPARRLVRGEVTNPAEVVSPGALSVLAVPTGDFGLAPDAPEGQRRLALANWLADPRNPLPARVMVNRLWQHHFGSGIVGTPNDFGAAGEKPVHPQLLDWLAASFIENKWSLKAMHRLIVMSAAYRQSAAFNERAAAMDSENTLHWRYAPRRLEGEAIRDAMLMVSGQINLKHGGPGFRPFTVSSHGSDFYELKDMIGPEFNRRTIYRINVNSGKSPLMDALDCPDPSVKTPRRRTTTTPLQALGLMNNSFVQRQAALMAERMNTLAAGDGARAVEQAYLHALGRAPSEQEKKDSMELATREGLATLCWVLMNATEFVYVR